MSESAVEDPSVDIRMVVGFLVLAFAISWGGLAVLHAVGVDIRRTTGQGLGSLIFMGAPAIAAIAILRFRRVPIRSGTGLYLGRIRWIALAWLAPGVLTAAMVGIGLVLPGVEFSTDYTAFLLELGFTEGEAVTTIAELEANAVPVIVILVGLGLVLGATLFALAAFGEELGWRGLLLTALAPLGFWKLSLVTGLIWGIWHAPLILLGLQFPEDPVVGIFTMIVATVAWSPIYTYLTVRARSVLAATFFHGSFFLSTFTSVFLLGGSELIVSPFGFIGIAAALLGLIACVTHDRFRADEQITTGKPLNPWSKTNV